MPAATIKKVFLELRQSAFVVLDDADPAASAVSWRSRLACTPGGRNHDPAEATGP